MHYRQLRLSRRHFKKRTRYLSLRQLPGTVVAKNSEQRSLFPFQVKKCALILSKIAMIFYYPTYNMFSHNLYHNNLLQKCDINVKQM